MSTTHIFDQSPHNMIRKNGIKALIQELGVSGMVEFIRQFAPEVTSSPEDVKANGISASQIVRETGFLRH